MSYQDFVSHYSGRKLTVYTQALEELMRRDVRKRDSHLRAFVKAEKLNLTAKPDPAPRAIQPCSPVYNIALGVYIRPAEAVVYKAIDKMFGRTTVMKGKNNDARGRAFKEAWDEFDDPVVIGADISRFDSRCGVDALRTEHSVYNAMFRSKRLRWLLDMQLDTQGVFQCVDGYVTYKVDGRRWSGVMNTSLGNVLLMCLMLYTYYTYVAPMKFAVLDDGDDACVIVERRDQQRALGVKTFLDGLGFACKLEEPVYEFEHIEFCQCHPVEVRPGEYRMVRDPRIVLSKDAMTVHPVQSKKEWLSLRKSMGVCGLSLAGDLPVFGAFYSAMCRGAEKIATREMGSGMERMAQGMSVKRSEPTTVARVSFAKAFGIWPDLQESLEKHYDAQGVIDDYSPMLCETFHSEHDLIRSL